MSRVTSEADHPPIGYITEINWAACSAQYCYDTHVNYLQLLREALQREFLTIVSTALELHAINHKKSDIMRDGILSGSNRALQHFT